MTELLVKETEDGIRVKNGGSRFTMPLMWGDKFFVGASYMAEELGVHPGSPNACMRKGVTLKGKEVRKATMADVRSHKPSAGSDDIPGFRLGDDGLVKAKDRHGRWVQVYVTEQGMEVGGHPRGRTPATESDMSGSSVKVYADRAERKTKRKVKNPFVGVIWPDGSVDVRLNVGGWQTTYDSKKKVPREIAEDCHWLT